ncbi:alternate-type signal peptide domain-containing protein [Tersicoccus sp. Bi-70]|uniref:alternate-type signal peptide domain-containing protein n=1 Tax=Tersicoccus sp. Bi-70 TaxID=1897634 RepID=UPI0009759E69|nr:alternate-type signal peptide domain-containing protein [Tersicoccus sp. Bi-70]OMH36717.1 hypothetical protein BGP79_13035 [Tersicoccus sp. Bi-70]
MSASVTPTSPSAVPEPAVASAPAPTPSGRRHHAVKAIAAGALAVGLLTAGGGTFSRWYEEQPLTHSTIASGHLAMTPVGNAQWRDQNNAVIDPATYRMVPGDTVTLTATTEVDAIGDNLRGVLAVDYSHTDFAAYAQSGDGLAVTTTIAGLTDTDGSDGYTVVGQKGTVANDNGRTATVTFTVAWAKTHTNGTDWGSGTTAGEDVSADLSTIRVILTQK